MAVVKPKRKKPVPKTPPFFIIWNPDYHAPPKVRFTDFDKCEHSANILAAQNPGKEFFVLQAQAVVKAKVDPPKTTRLA